ncbi:hypothetical protein SCLCIDRAFT_838629 [Scleroderma citrinum Foug A]|uniref:Uncharacterized protein n=1 Tax=Scleroderma citrinum Foug A TaxID=1036808 RepID=A0A0C2ZKW6_9AGAM|nr:hypothetical protein SCLCIDRAFT_838629 [Scleroderma citrinum Foug A]
MEDIEPDDNFELAASIVSRISSQQPFSWEWDGRVACSLVPGIRLASRIKFRPWGPCGNATTHLFFWCLFMLFTQLAARSVPSLIPERFCCAVSVDLARDVHGGWMSPIPPLSYSEDRETSLGFWYFRWASLPRNLFYYLTKWVYFFVFNSDPSVGHLLPHPHPSQPNNAGFSLHSHGSVLKHLPHPPDFLYTLCHSMQHRF